MNRYLLVAALTAVSALQAIAADPTLVTRGTRYQLHPSDQVEIDFRLTPEMNATVLVQPDGYVTLPNLGDVNVGGLTLSQATDRVKQKASEKLNEPEVTVALKAFAPPFLIVGGQVNTPGKVEVHGPVTALQAVQLAGGFKDGAQTKQIILIRRVDEERGETKLINYNYILHHYQANEDVALQAGDMLFVPQNLVTKIAPYVKLINFGFYSNPVDF